MKETKPDICLKINLIFFILVHVYDFPPFLLRGTLFVTSYEVSWATKPLLNRVKIENDGVASPES